MTATIGSPVQRNYIVWLDLGERIEQALISLHDIETHRGTSERLQEKIEGVREQEKIEGVRETREEFRRLEAEGTPCLSMLVQWLSSRLACPANNDQRLRKHGYSLVLDYTRAY